MDDDIIRQSDGTWSVIIEYGDVEPIHGLPTRELASHVAKQMWNMERAGADNYAISEH